MSVWYFPELNILGLAEDIEDFYPYMDEELEIVYIGEFD